MQKEPKCGFWYFLEFGSWGGLDIAYNDSTKYFSGFGYVDRSCITN